MKPSDLARGFAGIGLAATVAVTLAVGMPHTDLAAATGLAPVLDKRADALARHAPGRESDRARAILETQRSLAQAPASSAAWLRLAYLDSLSEAGLTEAGERALAASYVVAPYGPDVTSWRLNHALDHWPMLSEPTRMAALEELRVTSTYMRHRRLMHTVSHPAGRLALHLTLEAHAGSKPRR